MRYNPTPNVRLLAPSYHARFRLVSNLVKKTGTILDLGCADGYYSYYLADSNNTVIGVDVNTSFLDTTWNQDNPTFIAANASDLPFPDHTFDTVFCVDMLEHVPEDGPVLKEITRVLKPGGHLVISVPNQNYPLTYDPVNYICKPFKRRFPIGIWGFGHLRIYNSSTLSSTLEQLGYEVTNINYLTHSFAAFFENYLSTIFQGVGKKLKTRHQHDVNSSSGRFLFDFFYSITHILDSIDRMLLARSTVSVGFAISATKTVKP